MRCDQSLHPVVMALAALLVSCSRVCPHKELISVAAIFPAQAPDGSVLAQMR